MAVTMTTSYIPVRKMNAYGTITVRLLNRDGTQPPAGTPELSAEQYPQTSLSDERYKLHGNNLSKNQSNLRWLSDNNPLLFEELLSFLEDTHDDNIPSISALLDHRLVPDGKCTESYVLAYYRALIDTAPMLIELANDDFSGPFPKRKAWSLFVTTRSACGHTVEHPHYREAILSVWIMQDVHRSIENPLPVKDHKQDLDFISQRFDEVYNLRHELRARSTINRHVIDEMLQYQGPLRAGCL
jgi:hypothetical protein